MLSPSTLGLAAASCFRHDCVSVQSVTGLDSRAPCRVQPKTGMTVFQVYAAVYNAACGRRNWWHPPCWCLRQAWVPGLTPRALPMQSSPTGWRTCACRTWLKAMLAPSSPRCAESRSRAGETCGKECSTPASRCCVQRIAVDPTWAVLHAQGGRVQQ